MSTHHILDVKPIPESVLYINDTSIATPGGYEEQLPDERSPLPDCPDNVRIYVPIDLNSESILEMLRRVLTHFGSATESNEMDYALAVAQVITRLEIYDQVWFVRELGQRVNDHHSKRGAEIARQIVDELEKLDSTAECFPYETIDRLCFEYCLDDRTE